MGTGLENTEADSGYERGGVQCQDWSLGASHSGEDAGKEGGVCVWLGGICCGELGHAMWNKVMMLSVVAFQSCRILLVISLPLFSKTYKTVKVARVPAEVANSSQN